MGISENINPITTTEGRIIFSRKYEHEILERQTDANMNQGYMA